MMFQKSEGRRGAEERLERALVRQDEATKNLNRLLEETSSQLFKELRNKEDKTKNVE